MQHPTYTRGQTAQGLVRLNGSFRNLVSTKMDQIRNLLIGDSNFDLLCEILQNISSLHTEQIRTIKGRPAIFDRGDEPISIEEFEVAVTVCGRVAAISCWCEAFNELIDKIGGLGADDRATLQDWRVTEPTYISGKGIGTPIKKP